MLKKLLIAALVLIALLAGIFGWALANANSIIQSFKPELEKMASDALSSNVTIGELKTHLIPQTQVEISKLHIASDFAKATSDKSGNKPQIAEGSKEKGLSLNNFFLKINLRALLDKKLEVTKLTLEKPALEFIKDRDGVRLSGFPKPESAQKPEKKSSVVADGKPAAEEKLAAPLTIGLDEIEIKKGSLLFNDLTTGKNYTVSDMTFRTGVKLENQSVQAKDLFLSALLLNQTGFELTSPLISAKDTRVKAEDIKFKMPRALSVTPEVSLSKLEGTLSVSADPALSQVSSKGISLLLNDSPIKVSFDAEVKNSTQASVRNLSVDAFSGQLKTEATADLSGAQPFKANFEARNLNVAQALSAVKNPATDKLSGTLSSLKGDLAGSLSGNMAQSADGRFSMLLTDGTLEGVNIAAMALNEVKGLPFLAESLLSAVPPADRAALNASGTAIKSLAAQATLKNGVINFSSLNLESTLFSLNADGTVTMDGTLNLKSTILFSKDFTSRLVASKPEIKNICDQEGHLSFPLMITGKAPKIIVVPNLNKLMEQGGQKILEEKAGKALEKVLGGKKGGFGGLFGR